MAETATSTRRWESPEAKKAALEQSRQRFLEESKSETSIKPRYGLFSYTGTLAVGENSEALKRYPGRDSDGRVSTGPRNFYTSPGKKGAVNKAYFSQPGFLAVGDPYNDPLLSNRKDRERAQAIKKTHDQPFKGPSVYKPPYSTFPYMASNNPTVIQRRLSAGEVRTNPRNFLTSHPKTGNPNCTPGVLLAPSPEYRSDEYERKKKLDYLEHKQHKARMQEEPFRTGQPGGKTFANDKQAFGTEGATAVKRPEVQWGQTARKAEHDHPFKPSSPGKKGMVGVTLSPPPEYKGHPDRIVPRRVYQEEGTKVWRDTYRGLSSPSPSVARMSRNIMKEVRSVSRIN